MPEYAFIVQFFLRVLCYSHPTLLAHSRCEVLCERCRIFLFSISVDDNLQLRKKKECDFVIIVLDMILRSMYVFDLADNET